MSVTPEVCRIRCHVRRGMFEDEYVVRFIVVDENGLRRQAASIVYGDSVLLEKNERPTGDREVDGQLRAYCVGREGDRAAVVLPQATLENGPSVLVPQTELVAAG